VAERPEDRRRRGAEADEPGEERRELAGAVVGEDLREGVVHPGQRRVGGLAGGDAEARAQEPGQRRGPLAALGDADVDPRRAADARAELLEKTSLSGPLVADDQHDLRRVVRRGALERGAQGGELAVAPDEGHAGWKLARPRSFGTVGIAGAHP